MSFIPSSALWIHISHKIQPQYLTHFSSGSKLSKVFDMILRFPYLGRMDFILPSTEY